MTEQLTMQWGESFTLGYDPIDDIHDEFIELLDQLREATDEQLPERLSLMEEHLQAHFEQENTWMEQTEFPARQCHIDEHTAVLKSVAEVQLLLKEGKTQIVRELIQALTDWFPGHTTHLDSALAHWMGKERLGGKPMVFRPMQRE